MKVKVGQVIKEGSLKLNKKEADLLLKIGYMNTPNKKAIENVTKYPAIDSLDYIWNSKQFNDNKWIVTKGYPALIKENAKLRKKLGQSDTETIWNKVKQAFNK